MVERQLQFSQERYLTGAEATKLHTVDVWRPEPANSNNGNQEIWLIYLHGGAWRDPLIDSQSFGPAVREIWERSPIKDSIAGFASINYRLSPYLSHSTHPSLLEDPSRNAHYPDHLKDVTLALLHLDNLYTIANRYLLIGHSVGATLSFELQKSDVPPPAAVLGVSGIYNFSALIDVHPEYSEFMENACPDQKMWEKASPCQDTLSGKAAWEHTKLVIISHSLEDELIGKDQATYMLQCAKNSQASVHFLEASGRHDEIWGSGHILAGLVVKSVSLLQDVVSLPTHLAE